MRPLQLKLKGINSYREEQVIDFETLTSQGLFGILALPEAESLLF